MIRLEKADKRARAGALTVEFAGHVALVQADVVLAVVGVLRRPPCLLDPRTARSLALALVNPRVRAPAVHVGLPTEATPTRP